MSLGGEQVKRFDGRPLPPALSGFWEKLRNRHQAPTTPRLRRDAIDTLDATDSWESSWESEELGKATTDA